VAESALEPLDVAFTRAAFSHQQRSPILDGTAMVDRMVPTLMTGRVIGDISAPVNVSVAAAAALEAQSRPHPAAPLAEAL
jgi:hypothetical protein